MKTRRRQALAGAGAVVMLVLLGAVLRFTILAPSSAHASGTVLSVISGTVAVQRSGAGAPVEAVDGQALSEGDRIITGGSGRAVITFFEGSTQTIEPNSDITLKRLASVTGGGLLANISQAVGTTWTTVFKTSDAGSDVRVETPAATAAVRDTMFYTYVAPGGETSVWTRQGIVAVSALGTVQNVTAGTQSLVAPGHAPAPPVDAPPPASELTLTLDGPGWMLVRSPDGYSSGLVPPGGAPVNQIPLATITDPSVRPELVSLISLTDGTYDVYLTTGAGVLFQLTAYDGLGWATHCIQKASGAMRPGETWLVKMKLQVADGKLNGCTLSDPQLTQDDPFSKIRVPNALALALVASRRLLPEFSVLAAATTASHTSTPKPSPTVSGSGRAQVAETPTFEPTEAVPATDTPQPQATSTAAPHATVPVPSLPVPASTVTSTPAPPSTASATPSPTESATPTVTPTSGPCAPRNADVNGDGVVTTADVVLVESYFRQTSPPAPANADVNGDGVISVSDVQFVTAYEGLSVCP